MVVTVPMSVGRLRNDTGNSKTIFQGQYDGKADSPSGGERSNGLMKKTPENRGIDLWTVIYLGVRRHTTLNSDLAEGVQPTFT
jgi:hypothetical protein